MHDGGLLAVSRIRFWLAQMSQRGIAPEDVLAGTGLDVAQVRGVFRGTPEQYRTVIANMLQLTGDPRLGIRLGANFGISDFLTGSTIKSSIDRAISGISPFERPATSDPKLLHCLMAEASGTSFGKIARASAVLISI